LDSLEAALGFVEQAKAQLSTLLVFAQQAAKETKEE